MRVVLLLNFVFLIIFAHSPRSNAQENLGADEITGRAHQVIKKNCFVCHGSEKQDGGLDFTKRETLVKLKLLPQNQADWEQSSIWLRIVEKDSASRMPQPVFKGGEAPALTKSEVEAIQKWLEIGAPAFPESRKTVRPTITAKEIYAAVAKDVADYPDHKKVHLRYFSIAHLHNNPNVEDFQLPRYRAALSKLLNSLSWDSKIHIPVAVDEHKTILRIDLAEIGWHKRPVNSKPGTPTAWEFLTFEYPYTIVHDQSEDAQLKKNAEFVMSSLNTRVPILRADWFVATAGQPPLYHDILGIPDTLDELLKDRLRVDFVDEFTTDRELRGGVVESGVSASNRMLVRYRTQFGSVWISLDYKSSAGNQNILAFPLASVPTIDKEKRLQASVPKFASSPDGGEVIFHLPNGLIAYMIVDAEGKRIDRAPANVVHDKNAPLGNTEVINGISCLACHSQGVKRFTDVIRLQHTVVDKSAKPKVERLFRPQLEIEQALNTDGGRFATAVKECVEPFGGLNPFVAEPILLIASSYANKLDLETAIAEISIEDGRKANGVPIRDFILKQFESNPALQKLGARTLLAPNGKLQRDMWESNPTRFGFSHQQLMVQELRIGEAYKVAKGN